jgi:hypothetical protein
MSGLGKWSMLDVLVLALLIFYAKATNLADATSMPGIYLFAAAVILTMIATAIIEHDLKLDADADKDRPDDPNRLGLISADSPLELNGQQMPPALEGPKVKS